MKNVVITGATSMIGIALINELIKDLEVKKIYAIVRINSSKIGRIPLNEKIEIIPCDNLNYKSLLEKIGTTCDTFYHLAWPRTTTYDESYEDIALKCKNIQVVLDAMQVAKKLGCKKFIGAGSQSEYGVECVEKFSPDSECNPVRADGIIHLAAGKLANNLANKIHIDCIWMRIFSIYGEYDRENSLISSTIRKLRHGEHCSFTLSEQKWDYLYADDAGKAFYLVGKRTVGNHIYCLGSGVAKPLRTYIEEIRDIISPNIKLGFGELPYPKNPIMNLCADITTLQKDTGWKPEIDFETGIRKIYNHMLMEE